MNASIEFTAHARISASHAARADHVEAGGLRIPVSMDVVAEAARPLRASNEKPLSPESPAIFPCKGDPSSTSAALDCAYATFPSTTRLHRVRLAACRNRN